MEKGREWEQNIYSPSFLLGCLPSLKGAAPASLPCLDHCPFWVPLMAPSFACSGLLLVTASSRILYHSLLFPSVSCAASSSNALSDALVFLEIILASASPHRIAASGGLIQASLKSSLSSEKHGLKGPWRIFMDELKMRRGRESWRTFFPLHSPGKFVPTFSVPMGS